MGLQDVEEVLALKDPILWKICAMDYILYFVLSEMGSQGVGSNVFCDFRIVWADEISEGGNYVFLSNFESNRWPI